MDQPKLWSRSLIVLMGINFCSALSFYLIMVKLVQFAMDTYSVTASVAGLTITAYVISALFSRMAFGGKIDSWGVKRAILIGVAVNAVAMVLYLVPMGFVPLMIVRVFHGFGFAITTGAAAAGAALVLPPERYGEGIGYYAMMQALATGIGPFVAILLTNTFEGYFPMFAFAAAVAVFSLFTVPLLKIPSANGGSAGGKGKAGISKGANSASDADGAKGTGGIGGFDGADGGNTQVASVTAVEDSGGTDSAAMADEATDTAILAAPAAAAPTAASTSTTASASATASTTADAVSSADDSPAPVAVAPSQKGIGKFIQLSVVPLASMLFLVYIGYAGILSFVAGYAESNGLGDAVSLYFVIYAFVIFVSRPMVGRRIDRLGENSTIYICLASLVLGFVLLAFASNAVLLLASAAFVGFGIGATQSIVQAVIARDAPADELGKANSTFFMSMDLGSGIGPVIVGAIVPIIGYSSSYLVLAVVAVAAIVDYYLVHGRTH